MPPALAAILEQLILSVGEAAFSKFAPAVVAKLPGGLLQTLAKDALGSGSVQAWISKGLTAAGDEVAKLVGEAVVDVKAFAEKHFSQGILAALKAAVPQGFVLTISPEDYHLFAADMLAGQWSKVEALAESVLTGQPAP